MDNKEIRDILLGRIVRLDDKLWAAAPAGTKVHFHGVRDGAGDVRLFGVIQRSHRYRTEEMEEAIAFAAAETALNSMGRPMRLTSTPERKACLYAPNWIAPVLLTLAQDGDGLMMTAYTGNSFLIGRFRCWIALRLLEKRLPEGITFAGKNEKPDKEPDKKPEKKHPEKPDRKKLEKRETPKRAAKRAVLPKKQKVAPKRLKK